MINEQLWQKAQHLAARRYDISYETDTLTNGQRIVLLRHPELPAVKAQGDDLDEAKRNLDEARTDYIYSLLEDGLPVPPPRTSSSTGSPASGKVWNLNASTNDDPNKAALEKVIVSEDREDVTGLSLGGDLVKHG